MKRKSDIGTSQRPRLCHDLMEAKGVRQRDVVVYWSLRHNGILSLLLITDLSTTSSLFAWLEHDPDAAWGNMKSHGCYEQGLERDPLTRGQ